MQYNFWMERNYRTACHVSPNSYGDWHELEVYQPAQHQNKAFSIIYTCS